MNYYGGFGGGGFGGGWPAAQQQPTASQEEEEEEEDEEGQGKGVLPVWGNDKSMNLNHLILTNIQVKLLLLLESFSCCHSFRNLLTL